MLKTAARPIYPELASPVRLDTPACKPVVLHARVVDGAGGGPDKTILRSCAHPDAAAHRMSAAYLYPAGNRAFEAIEQSACRLGAKLHAIPETGALDLMALRDMNELCRRYRVDIFHAHDYKSGLFGLMLRRFRRMKVVTTLHGFGQATGRTRWYFRLERAMLRFYDHVIAVSTELYDQCLSLGVRPERLSYIPNGIDAERYGRERSVLGARLLLGIDPGAVVIGGVGRLSDEKGFDDAIRFLAQTPDHVELHLAGEGPERGRLVQLAAAMGLEDRVVFHGWQSDLRPFYEAIDALLLSSRREGLPNVVLEAMAIGAPVAATPVGDVRDVLDQGRCGVLLDSDPTRWPQQMHALLTEPRQRAAYADAARKRVTTLFNFDRRMNSVLSVYDQLAA